MDLGYEDQDEFEDAIQGTFEDFLAKFPHMEVKEVEGKKLFKMNLPSPGPPRKLTFTVKDSAQLLDVTLLKDEEADLEIPHLEFVKGASRKREIDSLYFHLSTSADELEQHAGALIEAGNVEQKEKVLKAVNSLRSLLDVETSFDVVIIDRRGLSEFKPMDGVQVEELGPSSSSA
eukprot:gb/GFBE01083302.1/.p1 GENE.gb/GFBE01083302.1/~~gb/GFBE01083302.1/.p1  ORF type:complete len:175 (+),score=63.29 gb/GFBE01083302.1/:1-525(+)